MHVQGQGVLPTIKLVNPSPGSNGLPTLLFPPTRPWERSVTKEVAVLNAGHVPCTLSSHIEGDKPGFHLERPSVHLDVGQKHSILVSFFPDSEGVHDATLQLQVLHNNFENERVLLKGTCKGDVITLDGLQEPDSILRVPDTAPGCLSSAASCMITNHSNRHFRVVFPQHTHLLVHPRELHLQGHQSQPVQVQIMAEAAVNYASELLLVHAQEIVYSGAVPACWSSDCTGSAMPEPDHKVMAGQIVDLSMHVHATVDFAQVSCGTGSVSFAPTMLFQARVHDVAFTNTGKRRINFRTRIQYVQSPDEDLSHLYSVNPPNGLVEPGQDCNLCIRFAPSEVDDCRRRLLIDIPDLGSDAAGLSIDLDGSARRPWCRFEVKAPIDVVAPMACCLLRLDIAYLLPAASRTEVCLHLQVPHSSNSLATQPKLSNDSTSKGAEPLPILIEAIGTSDAVIKRFMVHNPTSVSYAFEWHYVSGPQGLLRCSTSKGVISPGRRYEMVFDFTAQDVSITEMIWTFDIPAQNVQVPVLFIGRVVEPRVRFSAPSHNFQQVLLGRRASTEVQLVNDESIPFHFTLDRSSFNATPEFIRASGKQPALSVEPWRGTVPPKSRQCLQVGFLPQDERPVNHTIVCNVKHKSESLTLNIKGQGFAISAKLCLRALDGDETELSARVRHASLPCIMLITGISRLMCVAKEAGVGGALTAWRPTLCVFRAVRNRDQSWTRNYS
jgi:hypothetical protein